VKELLAFCWDQWAQLGVSAAVRRRDRWAADPEALIVLTLTVGRYDARLFDEMLDWLVLNERLLSVHRLRNLAPTDEDRALVGAALEWLSDWRPRARFAQSKGTSEHEAATPKPLFHGLSGVRDNDRSFFRHGFSRPPVSPSHKSQAPNLTEPVSFAFRMRQLLGVGARAECLRVLLSLPEVPVSVQAISESAGYAKRNASEALSALRAAGVLDSVEVANEVRYRAPRERWAALLAMSPSELPEHREWPSLFSSLLLVLHWLEDSGLDDLSDYLRASQAEEVMAQVRRKLLYAGVALPDSGARGVDLWDQFVASARAAVVKLDEREG
jgi:DNA-binding transcriptional ArsR family regulator